MNHPKHGHNINGANKSFFKPRFQSKYRSEPHTESEELEWHRKQAEAKDFMRNARARNE